MSNTLPDIPKYFIVEIFHFDIHYGDILEKISSQSYKKYQGLLYCRKKKFLHKLNITDLYSSVQCCAFPREIDLMVDIKEEFIIQWIFNCFVFKT